MKMVKKLKEDWPYIRYLALWIAVIVLFAIFYFGMSYVPGNGLSDITPRSNVSHRMSTALYFSVITGTTVGYGDVLPFGYTRALAALEAIVSFVLLATFVTRIASRHQDAAIADLHSLAQDSLFNNFRHGLFIARKDMDKIIEKIAANEPLSERDWKNLRVAFRLINTHVRSVPQLYATGARDGVIDEDHEQLVLDSVERSLRRTHEIVISLENALRSCRSDEKCMAELSGIVHGTDRSFRTLFPYSYNEENSEAFDEMLARLEELRGFVTT